MAAEEDHNAFYDYLASSLMFLQDGSERGS